jgi:hypothetical protein
MAEDKVSLVCKHGVAKAIRAEYPLRQNEELILTGAFWQKDRILEHLLEKQHELQAQLAEMNEVHAPDLVTSRAFLRGRLEGQIELLESLIAKLGPKPS